MPKKHMGRHKGKWGAVRHVGCHKADGAPLRQMWAPRKALGRREANGAHTIKEDLMVHRIEETRLKET